MIAKIFIFFISFILTLEVEAKIPQALWFEGDPSVELTPAAKIFVDAETQANPAGERSNRPLHVEHLEIPLKNLKTDFSESLDEKIRNSLIFTKNSELYVRWILNPEDTQYNDELRQSLRERHIIYFEGKHFIGYLTSSRSLVVQDPNSEVIFSVKSSTNDTGGSWKKKKETVRAAQAARFISDYLSDNEKLQKNDNIGVVKETLAFYDQISDQAMIVRQYDFFNDSSQKVLIPLFSVFHESFGRKLALNAGYDNPEAYWFHVLGKKFGPFIVKLFLKFGIMLNSPHGQNFLLELNKGGVPTGNLFIRDFADSRLFEPIVKALGGKAIIDHYRKLKTENNGVFSNQIIIQFNPFFSGIIKFPSWIDDLSVWKTEFLSGSMIAIRKVFSTNSKMKIQNVDSAYATSYWGWIVNGFNKDPLMENYIKNLKLKKQKTAVTSLNHNRCVGFY